MEKERFISKLNMRDYNNQLEKILANKTFSESTKNLLLNMLYKIENAYEDYSIVNGDTKTKRETLEEILEIIEKDCDTIEIVKSKESSCDIKEKKITTYLNASRMMYEIYQINSNKFYVPDEYEIIKPAIELALNQGYSISMNEIVRDFDGWSWNIETSEIYNFNANLIYQTLRTLVGHEFLDEWMKSKEDYIYKLLVKLTEMYKTEFADKLFKLINQVSILYISKIDNNEKERLIKIQENLQNEYDMLNDKKIYIENLGQQKKQVLSDIKNIDDTINNDRKLKEQFIAENEKLDMNSRIFSLSDFAEKLETRRTALIKKLNTISKKMEPLNFIKTKTDVETKLNLLKELKLVNLDNTVYISKIKELIQSTFKAIRIQIENSEEKENTIKLLNIIRHYSLIYIDETTQIKNITDVDTIQRIIITKACKEKIITIFSKDIKENYEIIKQILKTDIIELEKMYFKFIEENNKYFLEIYDEENMYKTIEFEELKELNVKLNKKIRVFI